jgi:hypothetical protein
VALIFGLLLLRETIPVAQLAKSNFDLVAENARSGTQLFQNQIDQIRNDLSANEYDAIVIQVNWIWDYEPAYAVSEYLEFYDSELPKYLNVIPFEVNPGEHTYLLESLNNIAEYGSAGWMIEPKSSLENATNRYCVTLNNATKDTNICDN